MEETHIIMPPNFIVGMDKEAIRCGDCLILLGLLLLVTIIILEYNNIITDYLDSQPKREVELMAH